jgi:hypothetical protein
MQDRMLDAADILIHRQPGAGNRGIGRGIMRGAVNRAKYQDESTKVSIVSVSRRASLPQAGQATWRHVGWWSSGLPGLSSVTSSGSWTGRSLAGTGNTPQAIAQWITGIGAPQ